MTRVLSVLVALVLATCVCCSRNGQEVTLEIRVVEGKPSTGLTKTTLSGWGRTEDFYMHEDVLITGADIDTATVVAVSGQSVVEVVFTDAGSAKFAEITSRNLKKRLGIFVDGHLVSAPVVQAAITGGKAMINGDFTDEEADRIARGLGHRNR